jgi:hypothetical protein
MIAPLAPDGCSLLGSACRFLASGRRLADDGLGRLTTGPARLDRLDGDWWCVSWPRRRDCKRLPGTQGPWRKRAKQRPYTALPNAELAIVPGTSHFLTQEKPDLVNKIVVDSLPRSRCRRSRRSAARPSPRSVPAKVAASRLGGRRGAGPPGRLATRPRRRRARSSPRSQPRRPATPRPEGAPGVLSASFVPAVRRLRRAEILQVTLNPPPARLGVQVVLVDEEIEDAQAGWATLCARRGARSVMTSG